jgi:type IV pilus assembly protein PilE
VKPFARPSQPPIGRAAAAGPPAVMVQPRPVGLEPGEGMHKRKVLGFTMVELLTVVAIVGVLSAIAYPQYTQHLRKGKRAQVMAFMLDMAGREQQYFTDARSYALDSGGTKAYTTLNLTLPTELSPYYVVTTAARTGVTPSFQITATAVTTSDQAKDKQSGYTIKALTIDETGSKQTVDSGGTSRSSIAW